MPSKSGSKSGGSSSDSSSTRLQRNLAEKQRRYKLNSYISELANIVPMVSMSTKRLDKTSILRLSAAHLRIYQSSLNGRNEHSSKQSYLDADNLWKILEAIDGFLLVTTENGKIIYTSQSVEHFLGHQNIEMIGHSLLSFIHPADVESVQSQLERLVNKAMERKDKSSFGRHSFYCRIRKRSQPRSEVVTYQLIHITGHMSSISHESSSKKAENKCTALPQVNFLFKAFVRLVQTHPYCELSLTDAVEDEYVTRHSLDGTIIFADHRLSTITGHLPHEVFGMSAYHYIIPSDIPVALFAHKLMFTNINGAGLIVYRLRTRNQGKVYLKTSGYLKYDKSSLEVDHFICVNKLLTDEEGEEELKNFMDRFTPHIGNSSVKTLYESLHLTQITGFSNNKIKARLTTQTLLINGEKEIVNKTVSLIKQEPSDSELSAVSDGETTISKNDCSSVSTNTTTVYINRTKHKSNAYENEKHCNRPSHLGYGMHHSSVLYSDGSSNSSCCVSSEPEEFQQSKVSEMSDCLNSECCSRSTDDSNLSINHKPKVSNASAEMDDLSKEPMEICFPQSSMCLVLPHENCNSYKSKEPYDSEPSCSSIHTVNQLTFRISNKQSNTAMDSSMSNNITSRKTWLCDSHLASEKRVDSCRNVLCAEQYSATVKDQKRPNTTEAVDHSLHSNQSGIVCQNKSKKRILSPSKISVSSVCSPQTSLKKE